MEITANSKELRFLIGRFGNGSISCISSETKCLMKFEGALKANTDADGAEDAYPIDFWKNPGEHAFSVSMDWFADILVEFRRVTPVTRDK